MGSVVSVVPNMHLLQHVSGFPGLDFPRPISFLHVNTSSAGPALTYEVRALLAVSPYLLAEVLFGYRKQERGECWAPLSWMKWSLYRLLLTQEEHGAALSRVWC